MFDGIDKLNEKTLKRVPWDYRPKVQHCRAVFLAMVQSLFVIAALSCLWVLALSQKITNLPGYSGPPLSMYSGYINVDKAHDRNLFYWLVESLSSTPDNDPLVIWMQGGPGCSGLGGGLLAENGPFQVAEGGKELVYNALSWSNYANMLYIESPAGVGFSYSHNKSDYNTDDKKTAADNLRMLQGFLETYPKFKGRDLWITGESYGGVYIPTLAEQILESDLEGQLKGLMLGNPVIGCDGNFNGNLAISFNLLYWHGLVSYSNFARFAEQDCFRHDETPHCKEIYDDAVKQVGVIDQQIDNSPIPVPSLDPDDLYQDFCTGNGTLSFTENIPYAKSGCDPAGERSHNFLNRPDVQKAIHALPTLWTECSSIINYTSNYQSMLPFYRLFFEQAPHLRVMVYSGDVDIMTVPFAFSKPCLHQLDRKEVQSWRPWKVNGATAGYFEMFDNYVYATLKGAGHEAPQYQSLNANRMFQRFLHFGNLTDPNPPPPSTLGTQRRLRQGHVLRSGRLNIDRIYQPLV